MAKTNLASLSVDALLKLRDDIGDVLGRKANELKQQLSRLGEQATGGGRKAKGPRKGGKVAPKYRSPDGETWAGRGVRPRWLTAALKEGKKVEDFLIDKSAGRKKVRRKK